MLDFGNSLFSLRWQYTEAPTPLKFTLKNNKPYCVFQAAVLVDKQLFSNMKKLVYLLSTPIGIYIMLY